MIKNVCILTAGKGTRLGNLTKRINKAILPIEDIGIISKIINLFDKKTKFIIALGFQGDQVKQYLRIMHPSLNFSFVNIKNYEGPLSGPGHSLHCCKKIIKNEPFLFLPVDTLFDKSILKINTNGNFVVGSEKPFNERSQFCNFYIEDSKVKEIIDKKKCNKCMSFSGILFVKDTKIFWKGLESKKLINGETQISNGLRALIKNSNLNFFERNWIDVGNIDSYNKELQKTNPFDFSKDNEIIYFSNKKVVKFFCDINISENRYKRSKLNPNVFPKLIKYNHGFYEYNKIKGKTLYEYCNIQIFKSLLKFLDNKLWNKNINKVKNFEKICDKFYRIKTLQRLDLFLKNYPKIENVKLSNGIKLPKIKKLMSNFNWSEITNGIPVFFHGDLQFDNILYNNKQFKLIDWRQDFAGEIYFGDIYYDLSKLYGGLLINYNLIKKNQFNYYVKNEKEINYNLFNFHDSYEYINLLEKFILKKGLNLNKVKKIVGIIYLNMSPLHKSPFNEILYLHSKKILNEF